MEIKYTILFCVYENFLSKDFSWIESKSGPGMNYISAQAKRSGSDRIRIHNTD
jgi:hypothetical protein